jgi:large repetitive protein
MATNLSTPSRNTRQSTLRRRRSLAAVVTGASLMLGSGFAGLIPGVSSGANASTIVSGRAFLDLNADGYQSLAPGNPTANEPGLAGVTVTVTAANGSVTPTATNALGDWSLDIVADGPYRVQYSNIPLKLSDGRGTSNTSQTQFITGGAANLAAFGKVDSFGAITDILEGELTAVGNRIWDDLNGNGIQDAGEPGIPNVVVTIAGTTGPLVTGAGCNGTNAPGVATTATTNSSGLYEFTCLEAGKSFVLSIDKSQLLPGGALAGYAATTAGAGNIQLDSNGTDNGTAIIAAGTLRPGIDNTYDFGFIKSGGNGTTTTTSSTPNTGSIGNLVFLDVNNNGSFDAGDSRVSGALVELIQNGAVIRSATTGADGLYNFTGLTAGTYAVRVTRPNGSSYTPAQSNVGDDTLDSDGIAVSASVSQSGAITLATGQNNDTVDFGWVQPAAGRASIGDTVWFDNNGNNVQDSGDTPVVGATVELLDSAGQVVRSFVTVADGKYSFIDLTPGTYSVRVTRPAGSDVTPVTANVGDDAADSDGVPTGVVGQVQSGTYTLAAGDNNVTVDFGWTPTPGTTTTTTTTTTTVAPGRAAIGDTVFFDANNNDVQDAGDSAVAGALVELLSTTGAVLDSQVTGTDGKYAFTNLAPGSYQVRVTRPVGSTVVPVASNVGDDAVDSDGVGTGGTVVSGFYQLVAGQTNNTVDFGWKAAPNVTTTTTVLPGRAAIGDTVFFDANNNDVQDGGDSAVAGALVELLSSTGGVLDSQVTGVDGKYAFTNLAPGSYQIRVTRPVGSTVVPVASNVGDDAADSDGVGTGGTVVSGFYQLVAGQTNNTVDFGWKAAPNTTTTTTTVVTPLLASIGDTVWFDVNGNNVLDADDTPVVGARVDLRDTNGSVVATTVTDASGKYSFSNLAPGTYSVRVTRPAGSTVVPVTPNVGGDDTNDSDGVSNGIDGQAVSGRYTLVAGQTNNTVDFGWKSAPLATTTTTTTTLPARVSLGDYVWLDNNGNDVQDGSDSPIVGARVELIGVNGAVLRTTLTDTGGKYLFSELDPGVYAVRVTRPANSTYLPVAPAAVSNKAIDSDGYPTPGVIGQVTSLYYGLSTGQNYFDIDFGFRAPAAPLKAAIGDTVWFDTNGNNVQDADDVPVVGARVELRDSNGAVVATRTTDAAGKYAFIDLEPGAYSVRVTRPANSSVVPVTANVGGDDTNDSDGTTNGVDGQSVSPRYTLVAGQTNNTVDFGWKDAPVVTTTTAAATTTTKAPLKASIGDTVWFDTLGNGVQDVSDTPIAGATVQLRDTNGALLATTTTDAAGKYLFSDLAPGTYSVKVILPSGLSTSVPVTANVGGDDSNDSDGLVTGADGQAVSPKYPLTAGQAQLTVDFGFKAAPVTNTTTTTTTTVAPTRASIGDTVFFDTNGNNVQDINDTAIVGATVELRDANGTTVATTTTDAAGKYLFTNLAPGTYRVKVILPTGNTSVPVTANVGGDDSNDSDGVANGVVGQALSGTYTVTAGQQQLTVDFGFRAAPVQETTTTTRPPAPLKASIGDTVWFDTLGNGVQDVSDTPVAGATVQLRDSNGALLATTTTDAAGKYLFSDLAPGTYSVKVILPSGLSSSVPVTANVGGDDSNDSDGLVTGVDGQAVSPKYTVTAGQAQLTVDFGFKAAPVTNTTTTTTTTVAPTRASIGDTVFFDTNGNNVQDVADTAIPGASVELRDANGIVVATTTTDATGKYLFSNLAPGTYRVKAILPTGNALVPVTANVGGDDSNDSDGVANGVVGQALSGTYTVVAGQAQLTVDFGFKTAPVQETTTTTAAPGRAAIGDTVFFDVDGNNVFNTGDTLVKGALVELLNASGGVVDNFVTGADGKYSFTNLAPGNYQVRVTRPVGSTVVPVTPNTGDNDTIDSDGNGTGATVVSGFIPLTAGQTNNTVDFGWKTAPTVPTVPATTVAPATTIAPAATTTVAPAATTTTTQAPVVVVPAKVSLGDRLFIDTNKNGIQDANETGISGAKVTVYRADGTAVREITTGADGRWIADGLDAGS